MKFTTPGNSLLFHSLSFPSHYFAHFLFWDWIWPFYYTLLGGTLFAAVSNRLAWGWFVLLLLLFGILYMEWGISGLNSVGPLMSLPAICVSSLIEKKSRTLGDRLYLVIYITFTFMLMADAFTWFYYIALQVYILISFPWESNPQPRCCKHHARLFELQEDNTVCQ